MRIILNKLNFSDVMDFPGLFGMYGSTVSNPAALSAQARRWLKIALLLPTLALVVACSTGPKSPAQTPTASKKPLRIGLALGGGAARGFAHVGVIQALEQAGIRPDYVVGTSAGSLVAALYASGRDGQQLQQIAETMEEAALMDWTLPMLGRGVLRGEALARYVNTQVAGKPIDAMRIPLGIVATELGTGEGILFRRGDTGTAVRASSAVPGVFQPVRIGDKEYVDGGLVAPVPVQYARQMGADLVIAVDISSAPEGNRTGDTMQVLLQTFAIMGKTINHHELKSADLVVRPLLVGVRGTDFTSRRAVIDAGRTAMQQALPALQAALARAL